MIKINRRMIEVAISLISPNYCYPIGFENPVYTVGESNKESMAGCDWVSSLVISYTIMVGVFQILAKKIWQF